MKKMDSTGHSFLAYFKRATSPLLVLRLLLEGPMYGYEISQMMKQRSGRIVNMSSIVLDIEHALKESR